MAAPNAATFSRIESWVHSEIWERGLVFPVSPEECSALSGSRCFSSGAGVDRSVATCSRSGSTSDAMCFPCAVPRVVRAASPIGATVRGLICAHVALCSMDMSRAR
eukprot:3869196-Pleurochrysis_carterae.AAC.1